MVMMMVMIEKSLNNIARYVPVLSLVLILASGLSLPASTAGNVCWVETPAVSKNPRALKILFIGHSKMFWHHVPKMFTYFVRKRNPEKQLKITEVCGGSYSLADHWRDGRALKELRSHGPWDYVVLFEQTGKPESFLAGKEFQEYFALFNAEIRKVKAKTVLVESFNLDSERSVDLKTHKIMSAAAAARGALLVPVGTAWSNVRLRFPRLGLYDSDRIHPNLDGTYLMACVFYYFFMGGSAEGLPCNFNFRDYDGKIVKVAKSIEAARRLQTAACSAVSARSSK
jgi:hypothetical protein